MNQILSTSGNISSQYQVTLPKLVRDALELQAGDVVSWVVDKGKVILTPLSRKEIDPVKEMSGSASDIYKKSGGAKKIIKQNAQDWI
ncbi:MAG: AbrB/MazE/SpoVT family DNA-binding domain-containing protein [Patescibacteria group bacterium]